MTGELIASHPWLRRLAAHLAAHPGATAPDDGDPIRAAVALVFRLGDADVPELLLIERAVRTGDPWSGQIALPGGRHDPSDITLQQTAVRETREETGVDLVADGVVLGTLDELRPRTPMLPPIIVTPYVAVVRPEVGVTASEEVASSFWAAWSLFDDAAPMHESTVLVRGAEWRVPSYVLGRHVVWGMTERILRGLSRRLARDEVA